MCSLSDYHILLIYTMTKRHNIVGTLTLDNQTATSHVLLLLRMTSWLCVTGMTGLHHS